MEEVRRIAIMLVCAACVAASVAVSVAAQAGQPKPSFEVVSIKPSPPNLNIRGGGPRGDRLTLSGASLRMLVQMAYSKPSNTGPAGQIEIVGGPGWMDSDRYDVEAKADCSGGLLSRETLGLMIQSMLEDRFQLKAHLETRELPIYNLVTARDGVKMKRSADQTPAAAGRGGPSLPCGPVAPAGDLSRGGPPAPPPPPAPGQRGLPFDPAQMPRGAMIMMLGTAGITLQATASPVTNLINMLQQTVGRPVIDKTDLTGLFDYSLQFSREGIVLPGLGPGAGPLPATGAGAGPAGGLAGPGAPPTAAPDPVPSLFSAIQDLGLRLESARGPVEVVVIESAQKPSEN